MATAMMAESLQDAGQVVTERALCLCLTIRRPGNSAKIETERVVPSGLLASDDDAVVTDNRGIDRGSLRVSKQLMQAEAMRVVLRLDSEASRWINDRTLPSLFKRGVYLLPLSLLEKVDEYLQTYLTRREAAIDAFLAEYPAIIDEARQRLGPVFDAEDYPDAESMRRLFSVRYRYVTIAPPSSDSISVAMFKREQAKAAEDAERLLDVCRAVLREELRDMTAAMAERLKPDEYGKRKRVIRESALPSFREALGLLCDRDIADDAQLRELVNKAECVISGVDCDDLKDFPQLRERVRTEFADLTQQACRLVEDVPTRAVDID